MEIAPWKNFNESKIVFDDLGFAPVSPDQFFVDNDKDIVKVIYRAPFNKNLYFQVNLEDSASVSTIVIHEAEDDKKHPSHTVGAVVVHENSIIIDHRLRQKMGYSLKEIYLDSVSLSRFLEDMKRLFSV